MDGELQLRENGGTGTGIDAEVGGFQSPFGGAVDDALRLIAYVKAELRTGKEENVGRTTQSDAVSGVEGKAHLLLFYDGMGFDGGLGEAGFALFVKSRYVKAKANAGERDFEGGANEVAQAVVGLEDVAANAHIRDAEASFYAKFNLCLSTDCQHHHCD